MAFWSHTRARWLASWDSFVLRNQAGEKVFIDCGSNLGQGAIFFSHFFKPRDWRYILVEPNSACHAVLRKVARDQLSHRGKPAKIIPKAAWISSGRRLLYGAMKGEAAVGASLDPSHNSGVSSFQKRGGQMVPTFDLDGFLRKTFPPKSSRLKPCIVMKMDIEGAEIPVLNSLIRSGNIRCVKALYVEWHSPYLRATGRKKVKRMEHLLTSSLKGLTLVRQWH